MRGIIGSCRKLYRRLGIKQKLLIIFSSVAVMLYIISVIFAQIIFHSYDSLLHKNSTQILKLYTLAIETELAKIESFSTSLIAASYMQNNIKTINRSQNEYEKYTATAALHDHLLLQTMFENYISTIDFIDARLKTYPFGESRSWTSEAIMQKILSATEDSNGSIVWLTPNGGEHILGVRKIFSLISSEIEPLGLLVIELDAHQLLSRIPKTSLDNNSSGFVAISSNKTVYQNNIRFPIDDSMLQSLKEKLLSKDDIGFHIETVDNISYLITAENSGYLDWVFMHFMPYNDAFDGIFYTRITISLICIVLLSLLILTGYLLAKSIITPIIELSVKMKKVQQGNFEIEPFDVDQSESDEVYNLQRNFDLMLKKIDSLIKEDYTKEILLSKTRYQALQAQINPHFLYNTLETIKCLAASNNGQTAINVINDLASLLRITLSKEDVITIEEELVILRSYVNIQKVRYEERLIYKESISDKLKSLKVPKMILQPLVENAISYALESMDNPCVISVKSTELCDHFQITVEDNGPGMDKEFLSKLNHGKITPKGIGIGLKNLNDRLKFLFGEEFGIYIASEKNLGTRVSIRIPRG